MLCRRSRVELGAYTQHGGKPITRQTHPTYQCVCVHVWLARPDKCANG